MTTPKFFFQKNDDSATRGFSMNFDVDRTKTSLEKFEGSSLSILTLHVYYVVISHSFSILQNKMGVGLFPLL